MKKSIVILLILAVIAGSFVSCKQEPPAEPAEPHVHTYSDEWAHDDVNHWHNPTCGDTTEVSGLAAHTWNDGEETTPPTTTTDGVMTYTCTVCGAQKTESIPKNDAILVSTFAEFVQAFTDIRLPAEQRKIIRLTADIEFASTYTESAPFAPDATGLTIDLNDHVISEVPKNAFNLTGNSFTLKNGTITGNASNNRYSVNINYSGSNATTAALKTSALNHKPAAYNDNDEVWAARIKVQDLTATAMLCGYSTMEIKNCTFTDGQYRGLVMQGSSGIVENVTVLTKSSASSAGFVAHSYGTVLVKGTCSFKGKFGIYSALCPNMIFDSDSVVSIAGFGTYAMYLETQGKVSVNSGAALTLVPFTDKETFYMRTGSMLEIANGAILKDADSVAIAKPIPAAAINSSGNGASDSEWAGYGVAPSITDNRT